MITEKEAGDQLARLSGLDYFPKKADRYALRELRLAAEVATTEAVLDVVITDWLHSNSKAPSPADLRRLIFDRNEAIDRDERKGKCKDCGGSYFVTGWFLISYDDCRRRIKGEFLPDYDFEKALAFGKKLAESKVNQEILTAGMPCHCMPANHASRVGNQTEAA
jgi:hypothetical protein